MSNTVNQKSKRPYYIKLNGQEIQVSEEVYRAYYQPLWAERKRKQREKLCEVSNGSGGTKRCTEDCNQCPRQRTGGVLSLDSFAENGFEPGSSVDVAEIVADAELLQQLAIALEELTPENRKILVLFSKGYPERDIAKVVGLSQKAVNNRKKSLFPKLEERLKAYR